MRKVAGVVLLAGRLAAQSTFGSIVGLVRDGSGAAAPAAVLAVTDLGENTTRTTVASREGWFEFVHLKPGRYEVAANQEGFAGAKIREITLEARQTVRVELKLEPAAILETVMVTDAAPAIRAEDGVLSDTKKFSEISRLPLNYRGATTSPLSALFAAPGVQHDRGNRPSIGGGLPAQVEYTVDGVSAVNVRFNGPNELRILVARSRDKIRG